MTRPGGEFDRCSKQEAANAMRTAATREDAIGPLRLRFGIIGTKEQDVQPLNSAIVALATAHDQGWHPHPRGDLVVSTQEGRALRYEVFRKDKPS